MLFAAPEDGWDGWEMGDGATAAAAAASAPQIAVTSQPEERWHFIDFREKQS